MQSVAQGEGMVFGDRSAEAQAEAERTREVGPDALVARAMLVISGWRNEGVSFGAGNFPEAPAQIVIGFQLGTNGDGRAFSHSVYDALADSWLVREGPDPEASGAFPLEVMCSGGKLEVSGRQCPLRGGCGPRLRHRKRTLASRSESGPLQLPAGVGSGHDHAKLSACRTSLAE